MDRCADDFLNLTQMSHAILSFLTFSHLTLTRDVILIVGVIVTILGTRLCWSAPRYRMSIEEHTKDGKLTEDEARRKIARMNWFGPAVVVVGFILIAYGLLA